MRIPNRDGGGYLVDVTDWMPEVDGAMAVPVKPVAKYDGMPKPTGCV